MTYNGKAASERHLSLEKFEEHLRHQVPLEYPIPGEPRLTVFIDPDRPAIGLHVPKKPNEPIPETGLRNIRVRELQSSQGRRFEIAVTDRLLFVEAYPVLLAIADRLQIDGRSLDVALSDTMRILGRLLERHESLSVERELGLFGEVLFLAGLTSVVGAAEAIEAWRGPDGEEHDFGLRGIDIEIKTTNAERRLHWIGSLTQLVPTADRPLWLVSLQLTGAGPDDGRTLSELIDTVRAGLDVGAFRDAFEQRLQTVGWNDGYESRSWARWRTRDKPAAYAVTGDFPRLTSNLLINAGIDLSRIPDVRYRVDLTNRPTDAMAPGFLVVALAHEEMA
jgi:hypothetical protein